MQKLDSGKQVQGLNREWVLRPGMYDAMAEVRGDMGKWVDLPHDYMIGQEVSDSAPAGPAMGYYNASTANYTKKVVIPEEWRGDEVILHFDGVMMNATVDINGGRAALHHYGYTPFDVDVTSGVYWGRENRITVTCNPGLQPNSRWYSGAGIYRHVTIEHRPLLHIATDGIFAHTVSLGQEAHVMVEVTVENHATESRIVEVEVSMALETFAGNPITRRVRAFVRAQGSRVVRVPVTVADPVLWEAEHPELYTVTANLRELGVWGMSLQEPPVHPMTHRASTLFGIRTIQADPASGLLINGKPVKLKGGCIHHDNGILGAVSFYDSEYRKMQAMKDIGYNAVRTAHNPPSRELLEACDRLGLYVIDEAFDCWGTPKNPGDYSQYFDMDWRQDVTAFMRRDRNHPSVILWSTGNEIPERGGLGGGYELAAEIAAHMRAIDPTRLITNGICSFWSGLDDESAREVQKAVLAATSGNAAQMQNADMNREDTSWEERTEPFANCLDVVGYNYMDDHYELDGRLFPERVICGTESFPLNMAKVWEQVERLPYVIGDFTWTSVDYIGEAGIGKTLFASQGDPELAAGPFSLMSHSSQFPWRLGNDADLDINGGMTPQGAMRKLLWGGRETWVFAVDPCHFGKEELISPWGWPDVKANWCWPEYVGKPIRVVVYSPGDEVELFLNDESVGRVVVTDRQASFDVVYRPGVVKAVSWKDGEMVSAGLLESAGEAWDIRLTPDRQELTGDGDSLCYVTVELVDQAGRVCTGSEVSLTAGVSGLGTLAGFGSAVPITEENYTLGRFQTYQGRAMAVARSGYGQEDLVLTVSDGVRSKTVTIPVRACFEG